MEKYLNRLDAGKKLAQKLSVYKDKKKVIVLALPRGGVPVGYEIAKTLHVPLDIFIVRKLGVPGHEELAMGAIAPQNVVIFNEEIVREFQLSHPIIQRVIAEEKAELLRREKAYRGARSFPELKGKTIILVDDGIATGASARAAISALYQYQPARLILAIPVAEANTCEKLTPLVDQFICPMRPTAFYAVGAWYEDFPQTTDEEVRDLLKK